MKRMLALGAAIVALAAPASAPAFHHVFLPGGPCGTSANSGGNNPTARDALIAAGQSLPLPPVGTPAVERSDEITGTPTATCPAPSK
ncbi:MAG TPA: hypothetical protein VE693_08725 [Gaiellaceae bacterium]|jgi:hypothetical protein|nr:hypothetical protein [Gaiellaceae bacterium]